MTNGPDQPIQIFDHAALDEYKSHPSAQRGVAAVAAVVALAGVGNQAGSFDNGRVGVDQIDPTHVEVMDAPAQTAAGTKAGAEALIAQMRAPAISAEGSNSTAQETSTQAGIKPGEGSALFDTAPAENKPADTTDPNCAPDSVVDTGENNTDTTDDSVDNIDLESQAAESDTGNGADEGLEGQADNSSTASENGDEGPSSATSDEEDDTGNPALTAGAGPVGSGTGGASEEEDSSPQNTGNDTGEAASLDGQATNDSDTSGETVTPAAENCDTEDNETGVDTTGQADDIATGAVTAKPLDADELNGRD